MRRAASRSTAWVLAVAALSAAVLVACESDVDRGPAQAAVKRFHAELDAGRLDALTAGVEDDARRQDLVRRLADVHGRLGASGTSVERSWTVDRGMSSARLTLDYATHYEHAEASERFTFRMKGHDVKLVDYQVRADAVGLK